LELCAPIQVQCRLTVWCSETRPHAKPENVSGQASQTYNENEQHKIMIKRIVLLVTLLSIYSNYTQAQTSNEVFIEYLTRMQGISVRTGYELSLKQKEINKKLFNSKSFFIRSGIGFLEMDRNHKHFSLNSIVGFRFYNHKTKISFEPINLGIGYSHTRFKSTAFESVNGSFQPIDLSDRNNFITLHLQAFAFGYSIPIKNLDLKIRFAPEAIAYFSTQKTEKSDFGGSTRMPLLSLHFPIALNLKF
jgi:hypothetical protein